MTRDEFYRLLEKKILLCDGATGSVLQEEGMPPGVCPEQWILEHPEVLIRLQRAYVEAGSEILFAPTFTCNRAKLDEFGLGGQTAGMNRSLVALSKEAAGKKAYVAGDMTMTGAGLKPFGKLEFGQLIAIYKEQAAALWEAGVDLFVVETMMSLQEARAALIAIRETCDLPVIVSMTFDKNGKTLYGTPPECAAVVLESLGASVVGANCSTGPAEMIEIIQKMREVSSIPILAKPNAGMPRFEDGKTVYDMGAEEFSSYVPALAKAGANVLGGCCGTDPEFIRGLSKAAKACPVPGWRGKKVPCLASERKIQPVDGNGPLLLVGERMNPTGKKALQAELREGSLELLLSLASEQEEAGAKVLDLNVGMNGIDEKKMMLEAIRELSLATSLPLCIDTSHIDIMEAALREYPGRALINSISLEKEKIEKALPIVKKYGAMFIVLPLSGEGLPKNQDEKKEMIQKIMAEADKRGIPREYMIIDGLVATVGAQPEAALQTLETIRYCKEELKLPSIVGLSNVSFGLPDRMKINGAFLAMAMADGLTMAIANPSSKALRDAMYASSLLLCKSGADREYIYYCQEQAEKEEEEKKKKTEELTGESKNRLDKRPGRDPEREPEAPGGKQTRAEPAPSKIYEAVVNGDGGGIVREVDRELALGTKPGEIIDAWLVPAIQKVGELFERQIYFLPQLIAGAEAMKKAVEYLEPMLAGDAREEPGTIVIATVEGDIHDIGKNLVALMLKNYGYRVLDLGKNVPKEKIVAAAMEDHADIIVLSALMTTTMMQMKEVISYKIQKKCQARVMVGGAVVTESFAREIGADGYSKDAAEAVRLAERLLSQRTQDKEREKNED